MTEWKCNDCSENLGEDPVCDNCNRELPKFEIVCDLGEHFCEAECFVEREKGFTELEEVEEENG